VHQCFDERAVRSPLPEFGDPLRRQFLFPTEVHPARSGLPNPIHLPLRPEFSLELRNGPYHVKQQASRGIARVDMLITDLEVDLLALKFGRNLAEM
jgi:hypothetical protein